MPSRPSSGIANRPAISQPGSIANRPNIGQPGGIAQRPGGIDRTNIGSGNRVINGDINRNYNRDVNIDNDWGWDNGWDGCCWQYPLATGAAIAAGAAITSAAIGSTVYSLPSSCTVTVVNGVTYQNCDGTWYEPQFNGTTTTYIVVEPPQ
jgi:hypothetical protein